MKPVTREWIEKAEKDLASARRELRLRKEPNYDLACFLSQQTVEKYLKARLQEAGIRFDRTHDLARLLDQLLTVEPLWGVFRSALRPLSAYAVVFRYPGRSASMREARAAVNHAMSMRSLIRESLGLGSVRAQSNAQRTKKKRTRKK
jgi:HEPN domain-containing protein